MKTLKINLTYDCTSKCDHCRFFCEKSTDRKTPNIETPFDVAKILKKNYGLDYAVILGGEVSLFPAELFSLLKRLNSLGIKTRVESNASFADSLEAARSFLSGLCETNTQIMFSLDAFHEKYVDVSCVLNAIKSCKELNVSFNLEVPYLDIEHKDNPTDKRTQLLLSELRRQFDFEIPVYEGQIVFTGRAAQVFGDQFSKGKGVPVASCDCVPWWFDSKIDSTDLIIYEPDGYMTKGCGIAIGNIHKTELIQLLSSFNASEHPIFGVLMREGPIGLARLAEKYGYKIKNDYADKCQLCYEARQVLKQIYQDELQPKQHYPQWRKEAQNGN